jgi:pseudouridine kinase
VNLVTIINQVTDPEAPVLVIGAAGVDILARLEIELQSGTSNPAKIRFSFGGVARNVAENLARLGQDVRLISVVGEDYSGDQLLEQVEAAGVDISAVFRTSEYNTGTYSAILNPAGELCYGVDDMRPISALTPAYLRKHISYFKDAALVFVDANLTERALRSVFSMANRYQLPVFADPTSAALAPRLKTFLSRLHLITPNSAEAVVFCEKPFDASNRGEALEAAKHLVNKGVDIVIITLAEFGLCYATSETSGNIPALKTEIVDSTGAGDALTAALIFALLNGISLDDAVRLGVSAASLTMRHQGAVAADLSLEKLYDQLVI